MIFSRFLKYFIKLLEPPAPKKQQRRISQCLSKSFEKSRTENSSTQRPALDCQLHDICVWIPLAPKQQEKYVQFLSQIRQRKEAAKNIHFQNWADLERVTAICNHIRLFDKVSQKDSITGLIKESKLKKEEEAQLRQADLKISCYDHYRYSNKLYILKELAKNLYQTGHRVLVFSNRTRMLNIIQKILQEDLNLQISVLDGTISDSKKRQKIVEEFNSDSSIFCLLITTKLGVGLKYSLFDSFPFNF